MVKSVPPGQKPIGRHDMLRQARIIDALAPTARARAGRRRHRRERAGLVRHAAGRGRVPRAGARRPRGARRRWPRPGCCAPPRRCRPCTTYRSTRSRSTRDPLSPRDELGRWARTMAAVPPDLVPDAERLHAAARGLGAGRGRPDPGPRRLPARQPDLQRHRAGRAHRLGDLERRRPAGRAGLVPGLRRRRQLPRRGPRGARAAHRRRARRGVRRRRPAASTTSRGSTPSAATRWPRSWATTCAGTSRAVTTTPTRNASRTPSSRLIETGLSAAVPSTARRREDCRGLRALRPDPRPAGPPAGVHGRARLPGRGRSTTPRSPRPPTGTSSRR